MSGLICLFYNVDEFTNAILNFFKIIGYSCFLIDINTFKKCRFTIG